MTDFSEQRKQLKIQQEIRKIEDEIVEAIQTALNDKASYGDLEEAQFRNLLHVADTTESVEVIKNFLLYQLGRDKKWGKGKNALGHKIIDDINDKIKPLASQIKTNTDADELNTIWIELIRRYLGYGARYLVYKKKGEV